MIDCPECGRNIAHCARGLCRRCYVRLVSGPKHRVSNKEQLRAYEHAYRAAHPDYERTRHRSWYERNREKKLAKSRADYAANREAKLAKGREWYQANKERRRETAKAWEQDNYERMRFLHNRKNHARRAHIAVAAGHLTRSQWELIKLAYGNRCAYCDRMMQRLEQDHVVPISKGGSLGAENVVPACRSCNSAKNSKLPTSPVQLALA